MILTVKTEELTEVFHSFLSPSKLELVPQPFPFSEADIA